MGKVFVLTHNYTGNAMVKQARELVRSRSLGAIRKVVVEYPQGWLADAIERTGQKQASWRTDPKRSGAAGCMGDIGTHAENLARYITGLRIEELCADLTTFVRGRKLDDDGNVLVRFKGGAKGVLHASQISVGDENNLNIRVYGTRAALEWHQEHPNELVVKFADQPRQIWTPRQRLRGGRGARGSPGYPPATPRATSRLSRTSIARRSERSPPRSRAGPCRATWISRRSTTASRGWPSSRPWSGAAGWARSGSGRRRIEAC